MSMPMTTGSALILSLFAIGCGGFEASGAEEEEAEALVEELAEGVWVPVASTADDARSDAWLLASGVWLEASPEAFDAEVGGGAASVRLEDGVLVVQELRIELAGIEHRVPGGARMTGFALVLEAPTELATEVGDDAVVGRGELDLRFDWALETETSTVSLASQQVEGLPIEVTARAAGGGIEVLATATSEERVFELDGLFAIEAIDLSVAGGE